MANYITGIQQVGIGVVNANEAKYLYRDVFNMNVLVFDDASEARLMTKYTGNTVYRRRALLTMNLKGGGGFEIWQFMNRSPEPVPQQFVWGTPGINAIKIKTSCIHNAYQYLSEIKGLQLSAIEINGNQEPCFELVDHYANRFQIVEGRDWFRKSKSCLGGVTGVVIGVSNMEKAIQFYQQMLGNAEIKYDTICTHAGNAQQTTRRVLLRKPVSANGAFSRLLGSTDIELVQLMHHKPEHLFKHRFWGDCGFIHVCFDVTNMDKLKDTMQMAGYSFTVDSAGAFAMEHASGRFCYVEDPDGTLIELVQTHRVPVLKKWGWYIQLSDRKHEKPLPDWQVAMLGLNKVK